MFSAKRLGITLVAVIGLSAPAFAEGLSPEDIQKVSQSALELCRGGTDKGDYNSLSIDADGKIAVVLLKSLAELEGGGKVEFTDGEWNGIKALVPENWDQSAYNACVVPITNTFIDKLSIIDSNNNSIVQNSTGKCSPNQSNVSIGGNQIIGC